MALKWRRVLNRYQIRHLSHFDVATSIGQVRIHHRGSVADRGVLEQLATLSGGTTRFLSTQPWTPADAKQLAAGIPDRSRREYETGAPDGAFKRRLNGILLAVAAGLLCCEWILRRLVKLA
jgi:hypothetical protein